MSYPVWLHTRLTIEAIRPGGSGFDVQALASTTDGPARSSRVTFSRGLHHACFAPSDTIGRAGCTMVDTHPHGGRVDGWVEAHEGPIVATYAGSVSATVVQLPAVETRDFPVFAGLPGLGGFAAPPRPVAAITPPDEPSHATAVTS